jgi:integrase/recombinase XerD
MDHTGEFIKWCIEAGYSERTVEQYRWVLGRYEAAVPDVLAADASTVRDWLGQFAELTPNSRRAYRGVLASFYRWAVDQAELLDRSPLVKVPKPKVPTGQPRPISIAQYERCLATADARMACWLLLGGEAGLRRSEIAGLHGSAVMGSRVHVVGKGSRARIVPATPRLLAALHRYGLADGRLWAVSPHYCGASISRHMKACGVDGSAHQLRHLFGTRFFQASGGDLLRTQQVMGHSSPSTTAGYCGFDDGMDDIIDRMAS